jgi:hypothetical protein
LHILVLFFCVVVFVHSGGSDPVALVIVNALRHCSAFINPILSLSLDWNDHSATITRICDKSKSSEELMLQHFANVASLCPEGAILTYQTHSEWPVREWHKMVQWRDLGYDGLDRTECTEPWARIMRDVESGRRRVESTRGKSPKSSDFSGNRRGYASIQGTSDDAC